MENKGKKMLNFKKRKKIEFRNSNLYTYLF